MIMNQSTFPSSLTHSLLVQVYIPSILTTIQFQHVYNLHWNASVWWYGWWYMIKYHRDYGMCNVWDGDLLYHVKHDLIRWHRDDQNLMITHRVGYIIMDIISYIHTNINIEHTIPLSHVYGHSSHHYNPHNQTPPYKKKVFVPFTSVSHIAFTFLISSYTNKNIIKTCTCYQYMFVLYLKNIHTMK